MACDNSGPLSGKPNSTEALLKGGDGSDGPTATASVRSPQHLLWTRGKVVFADGCTLRVERHGKVKTLVGQLGDCVVPSKETLAPVAW